MFKKIELINSEKNHFRLHKKLDVLLPQSDFWWQGDENDYSAGLSAYDKESREFIGSLQVYLADFDDDEPIIDDLSENEVARVDEFLKTEISKQFTLVEWMGSQLNTKDWGKGLVTAYIVQESATRATQFLSVRARLKGVRFVVIGSFNTAKKDVAASLIFGAVGSLLASAAES